MHIAAKHTVYTNYYNNDRECLVHYDNVCFVIVHFESYIRWQIFLLINLNMH